MVSKNLPVGIKMVGVVKYSYFGGCVKVRESLYTLSYYLGQYHSKLY
jgi:hypothetical protein